MTIENDSFEQSLRSMFKKNAAQADSSASLDRVLRTANRQIGAGVLLGLFGRAVESVMIGLNSGSPHLRPVSRLRTTSSQKKVD